MRTINHRAKIATNRGGAGVMLTVQKAANKHAEGCVTRFEDSSPRRLPGPGRPLGLGRFRCEFWEVPALARLIGRDIFSIDSSFALLPSSMPKAN